MKQIRLIVNTKTQKYPIIIGNNLISKLSKIIKDNSIEFMINRNSLGEIEPEAAKNYINQTLIDLFDLKNID